MNKRNHHRKPFNNLSLKLRQTADSLDLAESLFKDSLSKNFGTTIKHRYNKQVSLDLHSTQLKRLYAVIRDELEIYAK